MDNKTPDLFPLLPVACCLLPVGLWEYVHNSNKNPRSILALTFRLAATASVLSCAQSDPTELIVAITDYPILDMIISQPDLIMT